MTDTRNDLLDLAENSIRRRGYHAVSFRELADELGIKSASVHYYFRQKEDLGLALVERYTASFFDTLNENIGNAEDVPTKIEAFCKTYAFALKGSEKICLCGILGAETSGLPSQLSEQVSQFFQANIDWVHNVLATDVNTKAARSMAQSIVAALQGAMMLSVSLNDPQILDSAINTITNDVEVLSQ